LNNTLYPIIRYKKPSRRGFPFGLVFNWILLGYASAVNGMDMAVSIDAAALPV